MGSSISSNSSSGPLDTCVVFDLPYGCHNLLLRELPLQVPRQGGDDVAMKSPMDANGSHIVPQCVRQQGKGTLGRAVARIAPVKSGGAALEHVVAGRRRPVRLHRV